MYSTIEQAFSPPFIVFQLLKCSLPKEVKKAFDFNELNMSKFCHYLESRSYRGGRVFFIKMPATIYCNQGGSPGTGAIFGEAGN